MDWDGGKPADIDVSEKATLGKGHFKKCEGCGHVATSEERAASLEICKECDYHHRLDSKAWKKLLLDDGFLDEWDPGLIPNDPLGFSDGKPYRTRAEASRKSAGSAEAIEIGRARIHSIRVGYGSFLFSFMGGSMGSVVGEKITRLFENATEERMPVVLLQSSGGARMQEGILSLMQMAKTVSALERLRAAGLPFISVLLHPTTGGVAASFAFLGDLNIAEPNALIGFAGPRVIESTIRQTLPEGFQKAEFLLKHGMVDRIVSRRDMKQELGMILGHLLGGATSAK